MEIIPAIDIIDGKCVRLSQGKFDQVTVYSDDPVEMARRWAGEGAQRIHVVDLLGSREGKPKELHTAERIASAVGVPVQLGGGIRTLETARQVIEAGIDRVIIGTSAALDPDIAESAFLELGDRAVLGVDANGGYVAVKGWEEVTREEAVDFARRMQGLGARRVIYTDISRDGMMRGVNLPAMKEMADALDIPVIASGGVSTIEDIINLQALESSGIAGAILGKALYTGSLSVADAIAASK